MKGWGPELSGKQRVRAGLFGKLILQVEECGRSYDPEGGGAWGPIWSRWRDARTEDLAELNVDAWGTDKEIK